MVWLEKVAEKLKISVTTLIIILSAFAVVLIAGVVLAIIGWKDIQYQLEFGRLPEGDAIQVRYAYTGQDTNSIFTDAVILPKTIVANTNALECMGKASDCDIAFFFEPDGKSLSLTTMVMNENSGYPVVLSGVNLEFLGYEPYTNINLDMNQNNTTGDGSGVLEKLKLVNGGDKVYFAGAEEWISKQSDDPAKVIGEVFHFDIQENFAANETQKTMQADEAEFLSVVLPFSDDTPPGWYEFQVFMTYETPEGKQFRTEAQTMNVIVPEAVNFYHQYMDDAEAIIRRPYFLSYTPFTQEVIAQDVHVSTGADYTMIMDTGAIDEERSHPTTYWKYDLMTGVPVEIYPPYTVGKIYPSNDGWKQVIMMPDYQWGLYDLASDSTTLLDETTRYISPIWSPNDSQLAFFHIAEENTIGVFDVDTEIIEEVSFSMNGSLKDMQWLSEDTLVLMAHYGSVTNFYNYHIAGDRLEKFYGLAGIDEDRFVITSQDRIVAVNAEYGTTIPELKIIYPLDYGTAGVDGWYCEWLGSEFVAFCSTGGKVYLVDQVNETTVKILETGGLVDIERVGVNGLAVITNEDEVHIFDILGEEVTSFHVEGISKQPLFGMHFTFLEGQ